VLDDAVGILPGPSENNPNMRDPIPIQTAPMPIAHQRRGLPGVAAPAQKPRQPAQPKVTPGPG
jgi:hypothetical protein